MLLAFTFLAFPAQFHAAPSEQQTAIQLVQTSGASGGIISVVGATAAGLPIALAQQGNFIVHCLAPNTATAARLRDAIRAAHRYGTVSVATMPGPGLPYADNLLNLLVAPGSSPSAIAPEIVRVLAPLGCVLVENTATNLIAALQASNELQPLPLARANPRSANWAAFQKRWPEQIDEWSHYLHGPDGNPVANDTRVGPPRQLQWVAGPRWLRSHETDSSISTVVTAQGRLFAIVDEAPISLAGQHALPDKWSLIARDAFNGVLLWKVPIRRWGWREWKPTWFNTRPGDIPLNIQKRLVAAADRVYVTLGYHAPVSQLDARTGEILQTYAGTEGTGEILHLDGTLILSVLTNRQVQVMSLDAQTGRRNWITAKAYRGTTTDYIKWKEMNGGSDPVPLDPTLNMATDGRTIAFLDGPDLVALDYRTGAEKWRAPFPQADPDRRPGGIRSGGNLWVGTMIVKDGVVVHASPNKLAAFAADSGKLLWEQPKKYIGHLWYEWKDVFVIRDLVWTWGADLEVGSVQVGKRRQRSVYPKTVCGYDLHTGKLKQSVPLGRIFMANHHHRCYRNKATTRFILASRRGTEFVDLEHGQHTVDNWVRSTCHVGMMPANGLQYVPPHPCQCYIEEKLNGFLALSGQGDNTVLADPAKSPSRIVQGPAFGAIARGTGQSADAAAWPAYRHDNLRTGSVQTELPAELKPLWRIQAGRKVTPPIVVGDRVFVALPDEHQVACFDARTGRKQWDYVAGGRIDSPPTWHAGTLLFGSADGWVYCLRAADGQLAWRFRAAPGERLISVEGQLESAWPVSGSVLVQNDTVYFAAGRSSHLDGGLRVFGLAPATGELRYETVLEGPRYTVNNLEGNFRPPPGALPDILLGDGERIYMRAKTFDNQLQPATGKAALEVNGGFLDDTYFKRIPWRYGPGNTYARVLANDDRRVCGVRMFDSLRGLDPTVFFTPGSKGYLVFANAIDSRRAEWSRRLPVRVRALVLAGEKLILAGPPDVLDRKDPLGAFEGRKGGVLVVLNAATGEQLAEQHLPSPPVFNGAAAARGRLFLADVGGGLAGYGQR